ncbi:MAG TPA: EAL domain-containing protein [Steroidobacteraceae bacterium]|nr:EAL domain-containing protein [Steroidobacteraceae bacterium]
MKFEQGARRVVLVVDDDTVFSLLASETLQQAGYAAVVAGTGREALTSLATHKPDIILLDVELPDANGFDVCTSIRAASAGIDVPIVMVTGHNDTESIERAFMVGATDFILKPVLWQTLPQRIEFILRAQDNLRSLKISEQKNRALLEALPDTIYIVDGNGILLEHITGAEQPAQSSLVGKTLEEVIPADAARAARRSMTAPDARSAATYDFEVGRGPDRRCYETRLRPQSDGTLVVITRDITERRRTESRIKYLAYFDVLTGLPNRQLLVREMSRAIRAAQQSSTLIALLYLDLDRFKRINDNLGHSVGDALLKAVARRLHQCIRPTDVISSANATRPPSRGSVARLGGDEFVVLVTDLTDERQATTVADRIRDALAEPFECGGHRFVVTPSIGIALFPKDGSDIEDLLVKADMAMYKAKDQGRNGHAFYGESMAIRSLSRLELENDLRRAFDAGDFQLHHQPKIDLATGRVVGVEALLRWQHATRGWISPESFIPVAEESGLIVALGEWVLRETCRQLQRWAGTDLGHLTIAINVSVQQFAREDFVESVLRTLRQYDVRPELLELEITESLLLRNVDDTTACMKRFRAAGLTLSIDDFGTGYSSLGYLRSFPVDALKIDRSFVKDLNAKGDGGAICAAIIALARELKLRVIAEGVENLEQVDFLRTHGCDQVQGYLFSAPLPAAELERLLRATADGTRLVQTPGGDNLTRTAERVAAGGS